MKSVSFFVCLLLSTAIIAQPTTDTLVRGNTRFAFELYNQLDQGKNLFLSPYSISTALAMTYAGARGTTAAEMKKVLHVEGKTENFHSGYNKLSEDILALDGKDIEMRIANRLFVDKRKKLEKDFLSITSQQYKAPVEQVDYVKELEKSRIKINQWVEKNTNNRIKDLIGVGVLPDSTKLVLVNAIYFFGQWASQFKKENTHPGDFFVSQSANKKCNFMYQQSNYMYMENNEFQAIRIPYQGETASMEIYLPKKTDGLADFSKKLNATDYLAWNNQFRYEDVQLTMPKFKMTVDFSLGETLKAMGMKSAFSDEADFSGMTGIPELKIAKVIHKAFVDVGEKGTEAAAATAVVMEIITDSVHEVPIPKIFKADHPFFFVIRDNNTGSILFMGQVLNPEK